MRGRICVPFVSMHGMVKILFSLASEKKLLSHNAHASCMLVIRKACWYRQKGTGGINNPLNDETLIVSQLSSWFSFGALIDTVMCVSSIAPTTLGKVDFSLRPQIIFYLTWAGEVGNLMNWSLRPTFQPSKSSKHTAWSSLLSSLGLLSNLSVVVVIAFAHCNNIKKGME